VEALGIGRHFREIVYTYDLGPKAVKPSAAPFRRVQEAIGFAGPAVYVGDNPRLDIPPAKRLGWTAVRIVRPGGKFADAAPDPVDPPDYVIESLEALGTIGPLAEIAQST